MQVSAARTLREEVEDFLYQEAELLDEWRLDEWAALFTEDARYVVPTTDLPDGDPQWLRFELRASAVPTCTATVVLNPPT